MSCPDCAHAQQRVEWEINKEMRLAEHARQAADFEGAREHEYAIFVLRQMKQEAQRGGETKEAL